ncbi:hypothetical protein [Verrucomicrobium spinosum]|uniref:hypothetical protein n=1 Tax=Verrucomicrobium spinosum TaxID=2736 RepID=UPI0001746018|nr:hypothetical protein [Verrucomicrobium spinosum]
MTQQSLNTLQMFQNLSAGEREWTLLSILTGLGAGRATLDEVTRLSAGWGAGGDRGKKVLIPTYENAKERLLDDALLSTSEKALLASFAITELYEVKSFTTRQVTEFLRDTGNEIGNVTAALNAACQKGWAQVGSKAGESQQAQKKYELTAQGHSKIRNLLETPAQVREAPSSASA